MTNSSNTTQETGTDLAVEPTTEVVNPLAIKIPINMELLCLEGPGLEDGGLASAKTKWFSASTGGVHIQGNEVISTLTGQLREIRKKLEIKVAAGEKPEVSEIRNDEGVRWKITYSLENGVVTKRYQNGFDTNYTLDFSADDKLTPRIEGGMIILGCDDDELDDEDPEATINRLIDKQRGKLLEP